MNALCADTTSLVLRRVGVRARRVCRTWKAAYDADGHLFASRIVALAPAPPRQRFRQHVQADRLGFRHASVSEGDARHLVLWHPFGRVRVELSVGDGVGVRLEQGPSACPRTRKRRTARRFDAPAEASADAPECIKCGFRTWEETCADCGRPVL